MSGLGSEGTREGTAPAVLITCPLLSLNAFSGITFYNGLGTAPSSTIDIYLFNNQELNTCSSMVERGRQETDPREPQKPP